MNDFVNDGLNDYREIKWKDRTPHTASTEKAQTYPISFRSLSGGTEAIGDRGAFVVMDEVVDRSSGDALSPRSVQQFRSFPAAAATYLDGLTTPDRALDPGAAVVDSVTHARAALTQAWGGEDNLRRAGPVYAAFDGLTSAQADVYTEGAKISAVLPGESGIAARRANATVWSMEPDASDPTKVSWQVRQADGSMAQHTINPQDAHTVGVLTASADTAISATVQNVLKNPEYTEELSRAWKNAALRAQANVIGASADLKEVRATEPENSWMVVGHTSQQAVAWTVSPNEKGGYQVTKETWKTPAGMHMDNPEHALRVLGESKEAERSVENFLLKGASTTVDKISSEVVDTQPTATGALKWAVSQAKAEKLEVSRRIGHGEVGTRAKELGLNGPLDQRSQFLESTLSREEVITKLDAAMGPRVDNRRPQADPKETREWYNAAKVSHQLREFSDIRAGQRQRDHTVQLIHDARSVMGPAPSPAKNFREDAAR